MNNILRKSAKYIKDMRAKATEVEITINGNSYGDKDGKGITVKATIGHTLFKITANWGYVYERSVAFLVAVDALTTMPTTDDTITWDNKQYAIVSYNGEPPVRYSDPLETTYRIHTKHIGEVKSEE